MNLNTRTMVETVTGKNMSHGKKMNIKTVKTVASRQMMDKFIYEVTKDTNDGIGILTNNIFNQLAGLDYDYDESIALSLLNKNL